jgi:hypothetical protein
LAELHSGKSEEEAALAEVLFSDLDVAVSF